MKCTYLRSCLLGNFSFFSRISPQFTRITALRFFTGSRSKISHFFLQGEGELFLAFGGAGYTSRSYQFGTSSPFCIFSFVERNSWITLSVVVPIFVDTFLSYLLRHWAFSRASAPISAASCLWVLLLSTAASPFSILLSPYRQIDLPSSQCPCSVIWFEEFLMGSYKVVLCPRSGEGYFGLARRTYSLQCLPDIAAVRLNRFTFRFCG